MMISLEIRQERVSFRFVSDDNRHIACQWKSRPHPFGVIDNGPDAAIY